MRTVAAISALAVLAACSSDERGRRDVRTASVTQIDKNRIGVSIKGTNVDGYELARCAAAGYTRDQLGEDGTRLYPFFVRDGGKIVDEFRWIDGVRMQTARGLQTYAFADAEQFAVADHDGRDVISVDIQLAKCKKQGLPTTYGVS